MGTGALVIAFVSPAAVKKLLATPDMTSVSDMRSALVTNSHFTDLVSKLRQVLSRFSRMRGLVDVQGSALHELLSPEESEDGAVTKTIDAAVTFTFMHMAEEQVVEMIDPHPSPKCKDSTGDSGCDISFDRSQVAAFIDEQVQGGQSNEKEGESQSDKPVDVDLLRNMIPNHLPNQS